MSYILDFMVIFTLTGIVITSVAMFMARRGWLPPLSGYGVSSSPVLDASSRPKVLIVDNDPDFLETRVERLQEVGYEVYRALSEKEAEALLKGAGVHVAIIDVRLHDDTDDKDTSGIALAKREAYRSIPKIMFTRYPTVEHVREALEPAIKGLPPAVDFLAKNEDSEAMLRAVEQAFEKYVQIN